MTQSDEILVAAFAQLSSLEDLDLDGEPSDRNNAEFKIEDDSAHRGFDQHELNDLVLDLGRSKRFKNF